jgi:hypothetical protein
VYYIAASILLRNMPSANGLDRPHRTPDRLRFREFDRTALCIAIRQEVT